ncbi:hypothetical protein ZWY2020_006380 [Hordeum vulgare]|nr:hypothetical protein ZWY2020_006380 [Hordeum vulgare]
MGKKGDPKVPILPSTTRKGIVLSTSTTLDSPSIISKFASPPPHAASTESVTMPDTFDDAYTTIDETGLLDYFIESQIAKATKQSGIELPVTRYPIGRSFGYPDLGGLRERILDDDYIELDDDLCKELTECVDSDPASVEKLLEKHSMKNKFTPDPKFASSPICIEDADFDFSVDLSLISTVEDDPFYSRENDNAIAHLTKLTELGGLFTTEDMKRNYYVTKLLPFSLKEDAKACLNKFLMCKKICLLTMPNKLIRRHMEEDVVSSLKNKKKHKEADNSNDPIIDEEPIVDPNSISISDAEAEDGVEPDKDNEKNDPPEVREEEAPDKRKRNGSFLEERFLSKELSGRVVELDEVVEPSLQPVCSRAHEVVPVAPTPIEVETDDGDH